jgi:hypothetical protein
MPERKEWTVERHSQTSSKGEGQENVVALLRRVAESLDDLVDIEVQDIVPHGDGRRPGLADGNGLLPPPAAATRG